MFAWAAGGERGLGMLASPAFVPGRMVGVPNSYHQSQASVRGDVVHSLGSGTIYLACVER